MNRAGAAQKPSELFIWAHRGASSLAPENTLAAFILAESSGAPGIELDVHLSRDGVPVVIHDDTLDRTTSGKGAVRKARLAEIRSLDAGSWFAPAFAGEAVPTLEEVLRWAGSRLRLNIEIKTVEAGNAVLDLLAAFAEARVLVSSFHHPALVALKVRCPELAVGFLSDSPFWGKGLIRARDCGAESFNPRADRVSRRLVRACAEAGLKVFPWTVDDPDQFHRLRLLGVDGVFTNRPGEFVEHPGRLAF